MDRGKVPIETTNNRTHVAEEYSLGLSLTENHNIIHIHKKKKKKQTNSTTRVQAVVQMK